MAHDQNEFARFLQCMRIEREVGFLELARGIGMHRSALADLEGGSAPPPQLRTIRKIAKMLTNCTESETHMFRRLVVSASKHPGFTIGADEIDARYRTSVFLLIARFSA